MRQINDVGAFLAHWAKWIDEKLFEKLYLKPLNEENTKLFMEAMSDKIVNRTIQKLKDDKLLK